MSELHVDMEAYKRLLKMLAVQFGNKSEFVLHDLTQGYESTIVAIENNHLTNRKVGDCGSNLGLEILRQDTKNADHDTFGYLTDLKDGRVFRSSSMYLYNQNKEVEGCICINTDITELVHLAPYFNQLTSPESTGKLPPEEIFAQNVGELVDYYIERHKEVVGKPVAEMQKQDKIDAVKFFDEKGLFLISKSGTKICKYLKISKGTLYSYLENIRDTEDDKSEEDE